MTESLKEQFTETNNLIKELTLSFRSDFDRLEKNLMSEVNEAKENADRATQKATENSLAIQKLQQDFGELKTECANLKRENVVLKEQSNNLELYSRKNNIIIRGIKDSNQETEQQCETAVRQFFKIKLNIPEAMVEAMPFVRCHRLNARWRVTSRDVIVRFPDFGDRETIWSRKSELN